MSVDYINNPSPRFSLLNYVSTVSIPVTLAAVISFLLVGYSVGRLLGYIIMLASLIVIFLLTTVLGKVNSTQRFTNVLFTFFLLIELAIMYFVNGSNLFAVIPLIVAYIFSLSYYIKSGKRFDLASIYMTFLFSVMFTSLVCFILYLIYAYVIFHFIGTVGPFVMALIFLPATLIAIFVYFLCSVLLLDKHFKDFDDKAFFNFKHFPFTMLNISSREEDSIFKSIVRLSLILFTVSVLITMVSVSVMLIMFTNSQYDNISNMLVQAKPTNDTNSHYDPDLYENYFIKDAYSKTTNLEGRYIKLNASIIQPKGILDAFRYGLTDKGTKDNIKSILFVVESGFELREINIQFDTVRTEFNSLVRNRVKSIPFPDDTTDGAHHLQALKNSIVILKEMHDNQIIADPEENPILDKYDPVKVSRIMNMGLSADDSFETLAKKANDKVMIHLSIIQDLGDLGTGLSSVRASSYKPLLFLPSHDKNIPGESVDNQIIRQRLIETALGRALMYSCLDISCQTEIVNLTRSPVLCQYLNGSPSRNICYSEFARYDPLLCNGIVYNSTLEASCKRDATTRYPSYCTEYINNAYGRDYCWEDLADVLRDKKLCDNINDSRMRQRCDALPAFNS